MSHRPLCLFAIGFWISLWTLCAAPAGAQRGLYGCLAPPTRQSPIQPLWQTRGFGNFPDTAHDGSPLGPPQILVVHSCYNALGNNPYAVDSMLKVFDKLDVSAHFLIDRTGRCLQLVPLDKMAFHAGKSQLWNQLQGLNRYSIGVELLVKPPDVPTKAQYRALNLLIDHLIDILPLTLIVGHAEIAPDRKTDPWGFDWSHLDWFCGPKLR